MTKSRRAPLRSLMPLFALLLTLLASAALPACRHTATPDARLLRAESLMDEHPDSALALLQDLDPTILSSDIDKALYGMLYTQGLDKNHQDLTSDSLISFAADYFREKGDMDRYVVAEYYLGRTYYLKGEYSTAINCFLNAQDMAEKAEDWFWAGMTSRAQSDIYRSTYQYRDALRSARQSLEYFRKTDRLTHINYTLYDYGVTLYDTRDYERAILVADTVRRLAEESGDSVLLYGSTKLKGIGLLALGSNEAASELLAQAVRSPYSDSYDSLQYVRSLIALNEIVEARQLLQKIPEGDRMLRADVQRALLQKEGDYKGALELTFREELKIDSTYQFMTRHALGHSITDYHTLSQQLLEARVQSSELWLWIAVLSCVVLVLGSIIIIMRLITESRRKLSEKVLLAESLVLELKENRERYFRASDTLRDMLKPAGTFLEEVSTLLYEMGQERDSEQDRCTDSQTTGSFADSGAKRAIRHEQGFYAAIARAVGNLISSISTDREHIGLLEREVDLAYDNLMSDFRKEVPAMKEKDYSMFLYSVLGLGYSTMSVLLNGESREQLYQRRKRIKNKIRILPAERQSHYLQYLESSRKLQR